MNRFEMFLAMCEGQQVKLQNNGITYTGVIMGIRLEDGSGHCFLVTMRMVGELEHKEIFVRG